MQRTSLFGLCAIALLLITSCSSGDKSAIAIPKDAGLVLYLNTASLSSKLSWKEIQQTNWFKEAYDEADDSLAKKLLTDPDNSGVNTDADLVMFVKRQGRNGYAVFSGGLKDAAAFEAFNKKMKPQATASKDGDLNVLSLERGTVATWKDNRFIYVFDAHMDSPRSFSDGDGSTENTKLTKDSLINFAKGLYDLKSSNSLTNEDKFAALLKESGDVHIWLNSENLSGNVLGDMFSVTKLSDLTKGNATAMTLTFDNGKIDVKSKSYYNEKIAELLEKYKMKNIDADALARIPSDNLVGVLSWNYPPEGLKEFLKLGGLDGMVNGFLGEAGYSIDEFVKANKGDVLVAVSDFVIETKTETYPSYEEGGAPITNTRTNPSAKVLFAVSVNDRAAFDKMIGVVKAKMGNMANDTSFKISYSLNDKWFAAGNSEEQVNKFLAGGANNKHAGISKLAGHPGGMYIDLQKILKTSEAAATDSTTKVILGESVKMWEDVIATGGEFSNGTLTGHFEVNLVDKGTNSLKQLNQYADKLAATRKKGF
ncbi:DUF4836 family protein [Paraflavitalea soli]|uniref:DUF4836 family protein n=1 Tax=Paraflavitalea soli TaxID=2315862 RepID=A0A3B7MSL0_9BACT|nr:DUF4836 family protein [Paraflavitalea soli]AXY76040.1 DUF4836 family protein [Paraflavitalea soli]